MKNLPLLLLALICLPVAAQTYEVKELLKTQTFHLNSTSRTSLGSGDNRTYLAIELPPNTKEWYYSFSATKADNSPALNLFKQLADLFDPSGMTSITTEAILVPEGDVRANLRLADFDNAMKFNKGEQYQYFPSASRENYTQGVVKVGYGNNETVYLCLENPNALESMTLSIEVSALVGDKSEQQQALEDLGESIDDFFATLKENKQAKVDAKKKENEWKNYWNTGWILFENKQYDQSIIYTQKAKDIANHPGLCFNMGIAKWAKDSTDCLPDYLEGLNLLFDLQSKEEALSTLQGALNDFTESETKIEGFQRHIPSYLLLEAKIKEIEAIEDWNKKE
jgi:tetratricopeptide (TPR) repeat protein